MPVKVQGKSYEHFQQYILSKLDNYDFKCTKDNQPGPKFYTLDERVSFQNCPLFSSRRSEFMHTLPPIPIPFLPKAAAVVEECKTYWISHE